MSMIKKKASLGNVDLLIGALLIGDSCALTLEGINFDLCCPTVTLGP